MVFVPKIAQSNIKERKNDLDDLRKKHEDYVRKLDVKIRMLENENGSRKEETKALLESHKAMEKEISLVKDALVVLQKWMSSSLTRFELLEKNLSHAVNAKLDLATEISKARKRLDDTKKP